MQSGYGYFFDDSHLLVVDATSTDYEVWEDAYLGTIKEFERNKEDLHGKWINYGHVVIGSCYLKIGSGQAPPP